MDVHRADLPKGVIGLSIDEVNTVSVQRVADVAIKRIGIETAVDAGDGDHHRIAVFQLVGEIRLSKCSAGSAFILTQTN